MEKSDCTCKKKNCVRHGDCTACREFHNSRIELPRCERQHTKQFAVIEVLAVTVMLQAIKIIIESVAKPHLPDTRFADKMLTMCIMAFLAVMVILYSKIRRQPLSLFPQRLSRWYIIATVVAVTWMIATPSNYTGGYKAILVLIY